MWIRFKVWLIRKIACADIIMIGGKSSPDCAVFIADGKTLFSHDWLFSGYNTVVNTESAN